MFKFCVSAGFVDELIPWDISESSGHCTVHTGNALFAVIVGSSQNLIFINKHEF